jgi:hypothetical protein
MRRRGLGGLGRNVFLVPAKVEGEFVELKSALADSWDDGPGLRRAEQSAARARVEAATSAECGVPSSTRPCIGTSQLLHRPLSHEIHGRGARDVVVHDLVGMTAVSLAGGVAVSRRGRS